MGRIAIGKDMVQFSCKLEEDLNLWEKASMPVWSTEKLIKSMLR